MHKDIRLHGRTGDHVEYFAMVAGTEAYQRYFFNIVQDEGQLRIFSPGNDFIITPEGISYQGNGDYFCEYMFGVEQPSSDLIKPEIINRLVMYGARADEAGGTVRFSDRLPAARASKTSFSRAMRSATTSSSSIQASSPANSKASRKNWSGASASSSSVPRLRGGAGRLTDLRDLPAAQ